MNVFLRFPLLLIAVASVRVSAQEPAAPPAPSAKAEGRPAVPANADALIGFGFDLYRPHAAQHTGENVALSPACVASLLDALLAASDGKTETELRRVLHQAKGESTLAASLIPSSDAATGVVVRQAMGLWLGTTAQAKPEFLKTMKERFGTTAETIDFSKADEAARQINAWVGESTDGKIPSLVAPSEFNDQSRLAAVSALYFKAPWVERFDPAKTKPGMFQPGEGKPVSAPMMQGKIKARFTEWPNGAKALALDFQGGTLTFLGLLPPETSGLSALEASLTPDFLHAVNSALQPGSVDVLLPRFAIEASAAPRALLQGLGVDTLFREADFSRMTAERDLVVSTMNHKVSVAVDETGAEGAAAASATVMAKGVMAPKRFIADRPFVFLIVNRESLAPLMVGRVANPVAKEATAEVASTSKGAAKPKAAGASKKATEVPVSAATTATPAPRKAAAPSRPGPTPLRALTPTPLTSGKKGKPTEAVPER